MCCEKDASDFVASTVRKTPFSNRDDTIDGGSGIAIIL